MLVATCGSCFGGRINEEQIPLQNHILGDDLPERKFSIGLQVKFGINKKYLRAYTQI